MSRRRSGAAGNQKPREPRSTRPVAPPSEGSASPPAEPQALVVTHRFDPGEAGSPYEVTIRLTGRRTGAGPRPAAGDTLTHQEVVQGVVPGSGPVSVTSWIYHVNPGDWNVTAEMTRPVDPAGERGLRARGRTVTEPLPRGRWSWRRWTIEEAPADVVKTRWAPLAPLAPQPAVVRASFTVLAAVAIVAALLVQAALLGRQGIDGGLPFAISLVATIAGLAGAKLWHMALQRGPWRQTVLGGWSVDGFLVAAPLVALVGLVWARLPVGAVLDATAPGIFVAVFIGRLGCFLTGCCAGPCTTSRWGIWSSDRRIGARRIPTQLLESAAGLVLAIGSTAAATSGAVPVPGSAFVVSMLAYVAIRQMLLRLRAERREFSWRRSAASGGTA